MTSPSAPVQSRADRFRRGPELGCQVFKCSTVQVQRARQRPAPGTIDIPHVAGPLLASTEPRTVRSAQCNVTRSTVLSMLKPGFVKPGLVKPGLGHLAA